MTARELYQAGKLDEAVLALNAELRDNPADRKRRTFLFELLCFAGNFDRAVKQLEVLAQEGPEAMTGTLLYRAAIAAERTRHELFEKKDYPRTESAGEPKGVCNGAPFEAIADADPRIGARLEVFAAGQYLWIPLAHIASVEVQPPKRLRDLLWAPALVRTGPAFKDKELGEVLLPVLCPFSFRHADDAVRLGRATVWEEQQDGNPVPVGQKMLLVDGEELPILELRRLEIAGAEEAPQSHASAQ